MTVEQSVQPSPPEVSLGKQPSTAHKSGYLSAGPLIGLLFALAGGTLAWVVLQKYHPVFGISSELAGAAETSDQDARIAAGLAKANRQNSMLALAVIGCLVGGSLGTAEGVARRSGKATLIGLIVATVIGGLAGVVGGLLGDLAYVNTKPAMGEPLALGGTVLIQTVALSMLGAGVGLGLGASTGRGWAVGNCFLSGLLAGVCAGLLYPMLLAYVLPGAQTQVLVPLGGGSLVLWIALIAGLLGLIVPGMAVQGTPRPAAAPKPAAASEVH